MIDLTRKSLPNTITVGGKDFSIYTDFRLWMRLEISLHHMRPDGLIDIKYLFKNEHPTYCSVTDLLQFLRPPAKYPRSSGRGVEVISFEDDGDYIYAAFLQQYGIDLVDIKELHWHKFLALLSGLKDTKMDEIMGYRAYEKKHHSKDYDPYEDLRDMWEIVHEEDDEVLDEFNKKFGGE